MRDFEEIIGRKFMTANIENNEYSYQKKYDKNKSFAREEIAKIIGANENDRINKNLDRRFFHNGVAVLVEKKQGVRRLEDFIPQLESYIKLEKALGTKNVVGILYDIETEVYICHTHPNSLNSLQPMFYYESLFETNVKKEDVYTFIQKINEKLNKLRNG